MKNAPTLSIITVCRNLAREVGATCRSVVGQEWRDFEWIVVDGASADGTVKALEQYRDRMAAFVSENDKGPYDAMNKGIRLARGEYCLFLNGGDRLVDAGVLGRVFGGGPRSADILYGDELRADEEGTVFGAWTMPCAEDMAKPFFVADSLRHQSTFVRRGLFKRFGGYDLRYRIAADLEKWIVFAENGCAFERLGFPVSVFRMGGLSSAKRKDKVHKRERAEILARHFSPDEIDAGLTLKRRLGGYRTVRATGKWAGPSLFSVNETPDGMKRRYSLFSVPVLKAQRIGPGKWRNLLFGVLPLWETGERDGVHAADVKT